MTGTGDAAGFAPGRVAAMDAAADAALIEAAVAWAAQDPDPETRAEVDQLVAGARAGSAAALAGLRDRFGSRLTFGTAGLRGEIAAGPNRMNRVLVSQAAAGIAAFLLEKAGDASTPSVVIGYDGRTNSSVFARDSAEVLAGAGLRVVLLPRMLPTPVVAFAVRHLDLSAGIMVTASHNPPRDNGYKVYLGDADEGSQIVSPADAQIEAHIVRVAGSVRVPDLPRSDAYEVAGEQLVEAYIAATAAVAASVAVVGDAASGSLAAASGDASIAEATGGTGAAEALPASRQPFEPRVVYTAMHGVGWQTLASVLDAAGIPRPELVTAQIDPDPNFPTVTFPNPEEPGALDLAFETARRVDADLIVANDPDADRLGIAIPDATAPAGFRRLTGNEVGALLGWRAAERHAGDASSTLACSLVSSPALASVAAHYGLGFRETLTGFKWVSRVPGLVFGFEEALGYLVNPSTVRDKDGISAAIALLSLGRELAAEGRTIADHLDAFSETFGHFGSSQLSVRVTDISRIAAVMARLRAVPPASIGSIAVEAIDDLSVGADVGADGGADGGADSGGEGGGSDRGLDTDLGGAVPPSDILRIRTVDGSRIMVRPSGTEPKLKVYLDVSSTEGSLTERTASVAARLAELEAGMRELIA